MMRNYWWVILNDPDGEKIGVGLTELQAWEDALKKINKENEGQ